MSFKPEGLHHSPLPLVDIIILNWNRPQTTLRSLKQLQQLQGPPHRVIVVDNGSTDDSVSLISQNFPDILILTSSLNLGYSAGNNLAIQHSLLEKTPYLWLLNNDTVASPNALEELITVMESNPHIGMVSSVILDLKEPHSLQFLSGIFDPIEWHHHFFGRLKTWPQSLFNEIDRMPADWLSGCSILVRSESLKTVGFLDPYFFLYYEDLDWSLRFQQEGWLLFTALKSIVYHENKRVSPDSPSRFRTHYYAIRNQLYFWNKHHRLSQSNFLKKMLTEVYHKLKQDLPWQIKWGFIEAQRQAIFDFWNNIGGIAPYENNRVDNSVDP